MFVCLLFTSKALRKCLFLFILYPLSREEVDTFFFFFLSLQHCSHSLVQGRIIPRARLVISHLEH